MAQGKYTFGPGKLIVNEIFGPTIQGEGLSLGRPTFFLRLTFCNQHCGFCDTKYTWDWQKYNLEDEAHPMTVEEVALRLEAMDTNKIRTLVISGGEPMLQQEGLRDLIWRLREKFHWWVEIETAGTLVPIEDLGVSRFNVSPKLQNSGNPFKTRYIPAALDALMLSSNAIFKFVVDQPSDFKEIDKIVQKHLLMPVLIMPEGITKEALDAKTQWIVEECIKRNYRFTPRLHVQVWGTRRGV